jgi:hypothetical protein
MKLKSKIPFVLLLLASFFSFGQIGDYNYKQELIGLTDQWHKIVLPNEVFGSVLPSLNDIRIYGITAKNDTVEAPYLLRLSQEKVQYSEVAFKMLNTSHNKKGYFFTFAIPTKKPINQISLDFKQRNFDWKLTLEGSHNQKEWFIIAENYRIVSIKNDQTDFQFTNLTFPSSNYSYFRIQIASNEKPELTNAKISNYEVTDGALINYSIKSFKPIEVKKSKNTEIDIILSSNVPMCYLKIYVNNSFDYYRPVIVKYLSDSIKTEQGWKYSYSNIASGTLNSLEKNEFKFSSTILNKLKIIIFNGDNKPLTIDKVDAKGYYHELLIRFTEPATYFLTYGNKNARAPQYDIAQFTDKIPKTLSLLELGKRVAIKKSEQPVSEPLFIDKNWLWSIIIVIVLLLGWFSINMMRKKSDMA